MSVNLGNYFEDCSRSYLIQDHKKLTSATLSKILRSGTNENDILEAIEKTENLAQDNLCDALDREHDIAIFKALVDKIPEIKESVVKCALYQDRIEELRIILNSGKMEPLDPIELFEKAKSDQTRNLLSSFHPKENFQKPIPKPQEPYIKYDGSLSYEELQVIQYNKLCDSFFIKAIQAANERNFETARFSWDAIPDEKVRCKAEIELFEICFKFRDFEALEFLIKIAKMNKNHMVKDASLCKLIDDCLQLQDKEVANSIIPLALKEITDYYTHIQYKQKSGFYYI